MMRMDSEHQDGDTSMGQGINKIVLCTYFRQLEINETPESLQFFWRRPGAVRVLPRRWPSVGSAEGAKAYISFCFAKFCISAVSDD